MSSRTWLMMIVVSGLLVGLCDRGTAAYIDEVLDDGPRSYWRLGEGSGTTAFDAATGDGSQDGTYSGGFTPGVSGALRADSDTAVTFNGVDGLVTINDALDPTAYTIEAWVKPEQVRGQSILVRTAGDPNSTWSHQIRMTDSGTFQAYTFDGNVRRVNGSTFVQAGRWYHVAATAQNNGVMRLYVDGVEEGSPPSVGTLWTGGGQYLIGSDSGDAAGAGPIDFFDGTIDEVALYLEPLSQERIEAHHTAGVLPEPASATLMLAALSLLLCSGRSRRK